MSFCQMTGRMVREINVQSSFSEIGTTGWMFSVTLSPSFGPEPFVVVELERHADQRRHRIGQLLGEILAAVLGETGRWDEGRADCQQKTIGPHRISVDSWERPVDHR